MNREILFRGKRPNNGEWVYGVPLLYSGGQVGIAKCTKETRILPYDGDLVFHAVEELFSPKVDPATVGQWTGLTDRAGRRIFEGDILSRDCYDASGRIVKVVWAAELAQFSAQTPSGYGLSMLPPNGKVIGNVYDHPELLEGDKK